jgi:hypothetical protein
MIKDYQIDGLNKLVNSNVIKSIYPMVDRLIISYFGVFPIRDIEHYRMDVDIFLNDPDITKNNMYEMGFDPHYLVDFYLKDYLPYFNLDRAFFGRVRIWGPDGGIIMSFYA